jgi:hypothetical protein
MHDVILYARLFYEKRFFFYFSETTRTYNHEK